LKSALNEANKNEYRSTFYSFSQQLYERLETEGYANDWKLKHLLTVRGQKEKINS